VDPSPERLAAWGKLLESTSPLPGPAALARGFRSRYRLGSRAAIMIPAARMRERASARSSVDEGPRVAKIIERAEILGKDSSIFGKTRANTECNY